MPRPARAGCFADHVDDGHVGVHDPAHQALEVVPCVRWAERQSICAPTQDGVGPPAMTIGHEADGGERDRGDVLVVVGVRVVTTWASWPAAAIATVR